MTRRRSSPLQVPAAGPPPGSAALPDSAPPTVRAPGLASGADDVRVPLVPLAPEDFPSPAAYAAAWDAQLAHEQERLVAFAVGAAHPADAADQVAPARRARFRAELQARALAGRYGIASPARWPEQAPVVEGAATPVEPPRILALPRGPDPDAAGAAGSSAWEAEWAPWYDDLRVAAGPGCELWDAPAEQRLRLPPGLPAGRHVALTVRGASMAPLLADGDLVLIRLGTRAARGRVVVARHAGAGYEAGYVVKHVQAVRGGVVTLASLDPAFGGLAVPDDDRHVLGTVVARWAGASRGSDT